MQKTTFCCYCSTSFSPFRKPELSRLQALSFIFILALILFVSTTNVYSAQVTFAWNQNTETDLAGYKIYGGTSSRYSDTFIKYDTFIDVGNQTSYTISDFEEGKTYYIAVTAYDTSNNESGYSKTERVYNVSTPIGTTITAGDLDGNGQDDVIIDYGPGNGIWIFMNNSTWKSLIDVSPGILEIITTRDMDGNGKDEVIVDGGDLGIWAYMNNSTWVELHDPVVMISGDGDMAIDMGKSAAISTGNKLVVDVALYPASRSGDNADWWVAADTPFGWYYFDVDTMNWKYAGDSYTDLYPTYQGRLFDLSTFEVLNMTGLPVGTYIFYFVVDTNMNGLLDLDELFFDFVFVNIIP